MDQIALQEKASRPAVVTVAAVLFIVAALFWMVMAAGTVITEDTHVVPRTPVWILVIFMLANALVLLALARGLWMQKRLYWAVAVVYLVFNLVLTITDQFGLIDLAYLVVIALLLVFLVGTRRNYRERGVW